MLDQYKWRKKELHSALVPATRDDRLATKQKFAAQHGRKDVAYKQVVATLAELRQTLFEPTAHAPDDPPPRTHRQAGAS